MLLIYNTMNSYLSFLSRFYWPTHQKFKVLFVNFTKKQLITCKGLILAFVICRHLLFLCWGNDDIVVLLSIWAPSCMHILRRLLPRSEAAPEQLRGGWLAVAALPWSRSFQGLPTAPLLSGILGTDWFLHLATALGALRQESSPLRRPPL